MKKFSLILMSLLLTSCSLSSYETRNLEQNPVLTISLPSPSYALALRNLWNRTYPECADALKFKVTENEFHQQFQSDIEWVKDSDAIYKKHYAMQIDIINEYPVDQLEREELAGYFQPIEAHGLLYSYSQPKVDDYDLDLQQLQNFETYQKKHSIYYSHTIEQVLPYWLSNYHHEETVMDEVFMDDEFLSCIENMKQFYKEYALEDDPYIQENFYDMDYMSGLISTDDIQKQRLYKDQLLHFIGMPQSENQQFYPMADVYGFMVSDDCNYKNSAKAFMDLVRSKEGIQAYLGAEEGIAVLDQEDIDDFFIYDSLRKEMIVAMNGSKLWDLSVICDKPSVRYKDLYKKTDMVSILQNGIVADKSAREIQQEIHEHVADWIRKQ